MLDLRSEREPYTLRCVQGDRVNCVNQKATVKKREMYMKKRLMNMKNVKCTCNFVWHIL